MFKEFMMRAMLAKQLKGVPKEEQDKIIDAVSKNPETFTKLAESVQQKMKKGKSQMDAVMEAVKEQEAELKKIFGR